MKRMNLKDIIRKYLGFVYRPLLNMWRGKKMYQYIKEDTNRVKSLIGASCGGKRIFYLGITAHSNLGDMAQYHCIRKWIEENYADRILIEIEANTVVHEEFGFLKFFKDNFNKADIIVFQSGYTTQDLGGVHDLMHRMIIGILPHARILMMPQTVYFKKESNKQLSSKIYNKATNMLFLSRDRVSAETAKEMMPDVALGLYPDIVTTLIGTMQFVSNRDKICICRRNDGEKYYSEDHLLKLKSVLEEECPVDMCDTTLHVNAHKLRNNRNQYIENQIKAFSKYKVVITDRYHGTIFALAAGTPVIIIKTTDHKVVTGADWFKGVYDDYIYVAESLDDVVRIYQELKSKNLDFKLPEYFKSHYYNHLKDEFEAIQS